MVRATTLSTTPTNYGALRILDGRIGARATMPKKSVNP